MIEVYTKEPRVNKRKWVKIPHGPFPVTKEEFMKARAELKAKRDEFPDDVLKAAHSGEVTLARDILKNICPKLSTFDLLCLGNPLAMAHIKIEVVES